VELYLLSPLCAFLTWTGTILSIFFTSNMGTAVAQWLRCYAINRKVVGSIPAGVIGIFH